ncbi:SdpI family protein [Flavobacterium oreochromis]|uniref:SdpI family protein n=1 Tax=Flavobacterium columnare TaxID=996 RepID=A0A246G9V3_9FLAO|nr:hypothetical protein BWK62_13710 [Flavobacterium oreochromis]
MTIMNNLLILPLILGPVFMFLGVITLLFPPKNINNFYGYRSKNSKKNIEIWKYSQKKASIGILILGLLYTSFTFLGLIFKLSINNSILFQLLLFIILLVIYVWRIEHLIIQKLKHKKSD